MVKRHSGKSAKKPGKKQSSLKAAIERAERLEKFHKDERETARLQRLFSKFSTTGE